VTAAMACEEHERKMSATSNEEDDCTQKKKLKHFSNVFNVLSLSYITALGLI